MQLAWRALRTRLPLMQREVSRYASARVALVGIAASRRARRAISAVAVMLAAGCVMVIGAVFAISGLAGGIAEALDGRAWLGNLIAGVGVVAVTAAWLAARGAGATERRMERLRERFAPYDAVSQPPVAPPPVPRGAEHGPRS